MTRCKMEIAIPPSMREVTADAPLHTNSNRNAALEPAFSQPTWHHVQVLIVGTLLARGRRTVTAACGGHHWAPARQRRAPAQTLACACGRAHAVAARERAVV